MPQMAPLSWVILMIMFLSLYLLNTVKMYFTNVHQLVSSTNFNKSTNKSYNWKW